MPFDPKRLEELSRLAGKLTRGEADLDSAGDLANAVPELLAEVERLQLLVAAAREAMARLGGLSADDDPATVDAAKKQHGEILAELEAERGDLSRFGWSEEDFEGGGVSIK
jgi:hypothetical protein